MAEKRQQEGFCNCFLLSRHLLIESAIGVKRQRWTSSMLSQLDRSCSRARLDRR